MKLATKGSRYKKGLFSPKTRAYTDLIRPFTLIAPFFVSMFIMIASLIYTKQFHDTPNWWMVAIQASLTFTFLNAASNVLNQATDGEADAISKLYRPVPRGVIRPGEAKNIAYVIYLLAILSALAIHFTFWLFVCIIMLFTITYSLPPRIKQYLFINQIWIAIPRGLLGILASWSVFGDPFQQEPLLIGMIASVFLAGAMTTKDIVDAEADKRTGVKTLVNTFGMKTAAYISLPFMCVPFLLIPVLVLTGLLQSYLLPLSAFVVPGFAIFYLMKKGTENKDFENVRAWVLMYLTYLCYSISFVLLIIIREYL